MATPLYLQIRERVKQDVAEGRLKPGQRLPSSRQLARDLGVSRITTANAYAELEAEGVVEARAGSGTFVLPRGPSRRVAVVRLDDRAPERGEDVLVARELHDPEISTSVRLLARRRSRRRRLAGVERVGALCSALVGASYLVAGAAYWLLPPEQRWGSGPDALLESFGRQPAPLLAYHWASALGALAALGAVPAVSGLVGSAADGWLSWASALARLGFAVAALSSFRALALLPDQAAHFAGADAATRAAIGWQNVGLLLDPHGWLTFGAVGLWMLAVSGLGLRRRALPPALGWLGILGAALYGCVVAGLSLRLEALVALAAGLGGVLVAPAWYGWMASRLRRAAG